MFGRHPHYESPAQRQWQAARERAREEVNRFLDESRKRTIRRERDEMAGKRTVTVTRPLPVM